MCCNPIVAIIVKHQRFPPSHSFHNQMALVHMGFPVFADIAGRLKVLVMSGHRNCLFYTSLSVTTGIFCYVLNCNTP